MKIKELSNPKIPAVSPAMNVAQALSAMAIMNADRAFVVSNERPIGLFSREEALRQAQNSPAVLDNAAVLDTMEPHVEWFYSDWDAEEVKEAMTDAKVDQAIIRDRNGYMVGFVELSALLGLDEPSVLKRYDLEWDFRLMRAG